MCHSRYNYYRYYNAKKEYYKLNYLEKKRRDWIEEQHKEYYKDYWVNSRWSNDKDEKNKINSNNK
tara:strand:- start:3293 stop:3487 length:195 start_codon:yes stop_codon:yes gene_type:complete